MLTNKQKFQLEFEMKSSAKILFSYISTASGLAEWFADNVTINPEKIFTFLWDNETHKAKMAAHRTNHFCRFEYLPEVKEDEKDPSYFEIRLEVNEFTQTTFVKVIDYSDFDDQKELQDLWEGLIDNLKTVVGG